jgi:subtilase family serine protease
MGTLNRVGRRFLVALIPMLALWASPALAAGRAAKVASLGAAPSSAQIELVFPLVIDSAGLQNFATAVSTPGNRLYGHYESVQTVAGRFGAKPATRAKVARFLRSAGATNIEFNATGLFAQASFTVARAQRAFHTRLGSFSSRGQRFMAPINATASAATDQVPRGLQGAATGVVGLDTQSLLPARVVQRTRAIPKAHPSAVQPTSATRRTGTPSGCAAGVGSGGFTPNQYLAAYGYSPLRSAGLTGKNQRVAVIESQGFKGSDIRTFAHCFGIHVPRIITILEGTKHPLKPGGETTLDLEVLSAAAPGLSHLQVFEDGGSPAELFDTLAAPLIQPGAKPQVVSASYGLCEPTLAHFFGIKAINSIESDLEVATSTGITLLASSGDQGSAGCIGQIRGAPNGLAVNFPASSWWVTGVGGSNFALNAQNQIEQEIVWNDTFVQFGAGGGGISAGFGKPKYQDSAVPSSVKNRVVPDVSMLADPYPGYAIYCTTSDCAKGHPWNPTGGTSAAAPLLAAGVALVDQDLNHHEREDLGFMNPLLYAIGSSTVAGSVFSDITAIGNDTGPFVPAAEGGTGQTLGCCAAFTGYDPASGWGSVKLGGLDAVALRTLPRYGNVSLSVPKPQNPVSSGKIKLKLSCSDTCRAYAFIIVSYAKHKTFSVKSRKYHFSKRGLKTIEVGFSSSQLAKMRSAIHQHHHSVFFEAFGAAVDARGQLAKLTAGRPLTIRP